MSSSPDAPSDPDATMVTKAATGDDAAFAALFEQHLEVAWRMAQAVTREPEAAADATSEAFARVLGSLRESGVDAARPFRVLLLAAVYDAASGSLPRSGEVRARSQSILAGAFDRLSETARSVLWLTDVEGLAPWETAQVVNLDVEATDQLAAHARAELRANFFRSQSTTDLPPGCQPTVARLYAYASNELSADEALPVQAHLAFCTSCSGRMEHLLRIKLELPRLALPLEATVARTIDREWRDLAARARAASQSGSSTARAAPPPAPPPAPDPVRTPARSEAPPVTVDPPPATPAAPEPVPEAVTPPRRSRPSARQARVFRARRAAVAAVVVGLASVAISLVLLSQGGDDESAPPPPVATVSDVNTPIEPGALALVREVAAAAAAGDYPALERLLDAPDVGEQMEILRSRGTLDRLVTLLQTHPGTTDGYREGYFYPGFVFSRFRALSDVHKVDLAHLGVSLEGPGRERCDGYRGITTGFETRTEGGDRRHVWNGVVRRC